jgi:hypothetical protein
MTLEIASALFDRARNGDELLQILDSIASDEQQEAEQDS